MRLRYTDALGGRSCMYLTLGVWRQLGEGGDPESHCHFQPVRVPALGVRQLVISQPFRRPDGDAQYEPYAILAACPWNVL
jgi:hypothetical protein